MSAPKKPCGTRAAYRRHRLIGEQPCDACRAAQSEYNARREARPPIRRCSGCNGKTRAVDLCPACREHKEIALESGDWIQHRGIWVWVPWQEEQAS